MDVKGTISPSFVMLVVLHCGGHGLDLFTDIDALHVTKQVGVGTATLLAIGTTYLYSSLHFTLNTRHNGTRIGCGPGLDRLVNRLVVVEGKE